jgi:uncharacterized protein YcfJ
MFAKFMIATGALAMLAATAPAEAASRADRCEDYAYRQAWRSGNPDAVGQGAVTGAIAGGVLGAILGKGRGRNIVGGAIVGTAAGAALGAGHSGDGYISRRAYRIAYRDCMNRGNVVTYRSQYRDDAVQYCMDKYQSYNPDTGLYLTYSGRYRHCP